MADINLGVFNADGTNRNEEINSPDKLANELKRVVNEKMSTESKNIFVTISEIGPKAATKLYDQLPENIEYFKGKFKSRDGLACLWDNSLWQASYEKGAIEYVWSDEGKYGAVTVQNETINKRLLYVSLHLPKKNSKLKKASFELLKKLVEEAESKELDGVIMAGDFNTKPSDLCREFSGMNFGIQVGSTETTAGGNSIDNVVTSDSVTPIVKVYSDYTKLTHYPLFGTLKLED